MYLNFNGCVILQWCIPSGNSSVQRNIPTLTEVSNKMMGVPMIKWLVYRFYSGKSHFLMDDLSPLNRLFWIGFVHYKPSSYWVTPHFSMGTPPPISQRDGNTPQIRVVVETPSNFCRWSVGDLNLPDISSPWGPHCPARLPGWGMMKKPPGSWWERQMGAARRLMGTQANKSKTGCELSIEKSQIIDESLMKVMKSLGESFDHL